MAKILVTPRSVTTGGHPALERLKSAAFEIVFCTAGQQPGEDELLRLLPGCVGYLAGVEPITRRVLEAAKGLSVISRNGVGVDNIDLQTAERLGIRVLRAETATTQSVAELAVGLMFALVRAIPFSDRALKDGRWERRKGLELAGRTLGLVGCGRIGRRVAELALGLGMKVLAYDVFPEPAFHPSPNFRYTSMAEVLQNSDVVSLHSPAQPENRPLIDAVALARVKKGVLLVNTARASLVDNQALAAALDQGKVAGAAIDVFETEPPTGHPLVGNDHVIATPHIGGYTDESVDRAVGVAVDNLLEYLGE